MKNADDEVIYVGKAINLRRRLSSYFREHPSGNTKVQAMISHIASYSYLLVRNESEALFLESNLIKRYQPFYNILLKDDHDYPYIKITVQDEYPQISKAYRIGPDIKEGSKYFGPYLNRDVNQALKNIRRLFPKKTYHRIFDTDKKSDQAEVVLDLEDTKKDYADTKWSKQKRHELKEQYKALGKEEYNAIVDDVIALLEGRYGAVKRRMQKNMQRASDSLDFEQAAVWRDRLRRLERMQAEQVAVLDADFNGDAIGIARNSIEVCILKLEIRSDRISGTSTYFLDAAASSNAEVLRAFMVQYYSMASYIPKNILVPMELNEDLNSLERPKQEQDEEAELEVSVLKTLEELAGHKVYIHYPQRGDKKDVIKMANRNAKQALTRRTLIAGSNPEAVRTALNLLAQILDMPDLPHRIEAYDVSNTGKDAQVCSMVVFNNGKVDKSQQRTFHIKRQSGQDDYRAMAEAIDRRLNHLGDDDFGKRPDLILLDGAFGHINAIRPILAKHNVLDKIYLAGMVKDQRHRTRGLVLDTGETIELAESLDLLDGEKTYGTGNELGSMRNLFSEDKSTSREEQLALLRLLSRIQNEAHRVAGMANRKKHKKRQTKYKLEEIPGVGKKRRQALMEEFSSIKEISLASVEEIKTRVPKLGDKVATNVFLHFHPEYIEEYREKGELEA